MKYISYLIFALFIGALLLFLKNALEPKQEPLYITGTVKCGECHGLKVNGNQLEKWKADKHSTAFKTLDGSKAKEYAAANGLGDPSKEQKCLKCHTTQFSLKDVPVGEFYDINEGIGCEGCHGAGSKYSPAHIMKNEASFLQYGGIKGDERTCLNCHNPKANKDKKLADDHCPFQDEDFNYNTEFEKIKHPVKQ